MPVLLFDLDLLILKINNLITFLSDSKIEFWYNEYQIRAVFKGKYSCRKIGNGRRCKLSLWSVAGGVLSFNSISRLKALNSALINAKQYTRPTINCLKRVHYVSGVQIFSSTLFPTLKILLFWMIFFLVHGEFVRRLFRKAYATWKV